METRAIIRTGPVTFRDCGWCEGVGKPDCPHCLGTGRITVDIHPFVTLEAIGEHIGALNGAIKAHIYDDGAKYPIGSPGYHLQAIDEYARNLLQQLILLLPEEWERTEGE